MNFFNCIEKSNKLNVAEEISDQLCFKVRHKPLRNLGLEEPVGVEVSSQLPSKDLR